jgi:hypothetical protein
MKQFILLISLAFSLSSFANSLKTQMQVMGTELKALTVGLQKGVINEGLITSSQNLSLAILGASSFLPNVIADQTIEENSELKLKYTGLMYKLYGASFDLQYALVVEDLAAAQKAMTAMTDLRKEGHQFFKPPTN